MAQKSLDRGAIAPAPNGSAEPRIVPPMRVEAGPSPDDFFALLARRRQRPSRCDLMRVGQVFEEETPVLGLLVPLRLEASRNQPRRHRRRNLRVERHFLPPAVPAAGQAFRKPGLENEQVRSARLRAIIGQTESNNLRQHRSPRAFHRDSAHACVGQGAAAAKRTRQVLALRGFRHGLGHAFGSRS